MAAALSGHALALLPRRWRFPAVTVVARAVAPLLVTLLARSGYSGSMHGRIDATVRILCRAMTSTGTRFDPKVRYDGPLLPPGALIISGHFALNALVTRYLFDQGAQPAVVKRFPDADPYYWGSFVRDHVIQPSPWALLRVRSALAGGRSVLMDIDSVEDVPRGISALTPYGSVSISTAVFDFARRVDVPLYFACGRSERTGIPVVYIRRIEPDVRAFLTHFQEQLSRIV